MVGLIAAPVMEWSTRLPELGGILKEKLQLFDRPLALLAAIADMLGGRRNYRAHRFSCRRSNGCSRRWNFCRRPSTEFLLFLATLVLFIATWPDLRRKAVMIFADHEARLRTLRILNAIETSLGGYLIMVTMINGGVGIATGLICWAAGMPNPAGLGALAATLNFFPIIGPVVMFVVLTAVGIICVSHARRWPARSCGVRRHDLHGRPFRNAGHRRSAAAIECARGVHRACVLDMAVGADGRLSGVADPDRRARSERAFAARYVATTAAKLKAFQRGTSSLKRRLCATKPVASQRDDHQKRQTNQWQTHSIQRLQKDLKAVKKDISALTEQLIDVLNSYAAGEQAGPAGL